MLLFAMQSAEVPANLLRESPEDWLWNVGLIRTYMCPVAAGCDVTAHRCHP